ncbi:hypothetical protein [Chitinophaga varians]|uniref:hypothetical protein n=1 Tax=Chitinophaga varians TaxID=2202339 RepID=UPI00165F4F20|nr:hypothetical protein [Chitinophaga varians]MBC9915313.1 hypothetical protein [Chitinophaga varians]
MKKGLKIFLYVFIGLVVLGFIANLTDKKKKVSATTTTTPEGSPTSTEEKKEPVEEKKASAWAYNEEEDKMTSKKKYFAQVDAKELLEFDFPYNGGSTATLLLRNKDGENNILLMVSKGQFMSSVTGGAVKVRFDENPPMTIQTSSPSDGSAKTLFLSKEKSLIANLKKAKKVLIEAEFFQSGLRQMEFDVAGLNWEH